MPSSKRLNGVLAPTPTFIDEIVILEYNDMPLNRVNKTDYQSLKAEAEKDIKKLREARGWDKS